MSYRNFAHDSGEGRPWKAAVLPFDASHDAVQESKEVLVAVGGEIVDLTHEGQFKGIQQAGQKPSDAQVLVAYNVSAHAVPQLIQAFPSLPSSSCQLGAGLGQAPGAAVA